MGCMPSKRMLQYREEGDMPECKQMVPSPFQLPTGDTFIPCDYVTGEYSSIYPQWLMNAVSPRQYALFIKQLNELNSVLPIWSESRSQKYMKALTNSKSGHSNPSMSMFIKRERKQLCKETDALLSCLNKSMLNPLGLSASFVSSPQMGVLVKQIRINCKLESPTHGGLVILPAYEYDNESVSDDSACSLY